MAQTQIVITINGPGEVSCWLVPLATALKAQRPDLRICVALLPCVFSTGAEVAVVEKLPFVDAASSVEETWALILQGRIPEKFSHPSPGFVMHLGGDPALSLLIAKRLRQPCFGYVERPFPLQRFYDQIYFSGFESSQEAIDSGEHDVVGELMIDGARLRCPKREPHRDGRLVVGLFPGSRDWIAKYMLPFFGTVAEEVSKSLPNVQWIMARADFLPMDFLRDFPDVHDGRPLEGENLEFEEGCNGDPAVLITRGGVRIEVRSTAEVCACANLALTVPGSNTAEMATLGLPMVVTLPTYWGETSPLPGLAGHVGRIPYLGRYLKRVLSHIHLNRLDYTAHPNRRSGRMVVPELVGRLKSVEVADVMVGLLKSDTREKEAELVSIMGSPGAAKRLAGELIAHVDKFAVPAAVS